MLLGYGVLEIGECCRLGYSLWEKCYDCVWVLLNLFKLVLIFFFVNILYCIGWCGEMCYGLLNDVCVFDKDVWLLMVECYVVLVYDKGVMCMVKDLLQLLFWLQFQVSEGEKLLMCSDFLLFFECFLIGFCFGVEFGLVKCWLYYYYVELVKQFINEGYQVVLFGLVKDYEVGNEILVVLNSEQQVWCCNLVGEIQLEQVVILIVVCKVIVINDFGLMYVVVVFDCLLVVLYGLSSLDFMLLLFYKVWVICFIMGYYKVCKGDMV